MDFRRSHWAPRFSFCRIWRLGWNVINVEYRMANVSLAPAAVEDYSCALRWAARNAKQYNIDVNRIVLTGHSAGGIYL
jgi:acetyl esterase/lipase